MACKFFGDPDLFRGEERLRPGVVNWKREVEYLHVSRVGDPCLQADVRRKSRRLRYDVFFIEAECFLEALEFFLFFHLDDHVSDASLRLRPRCARIRSTVPVNLVDYASLLCCEVQCINIHPDACLSLWHGCLPRMTLCDGCDQLLHPVEPSCGSLFIPLGTTDRRGIQQFCL